MLIYQQKEFWDKFYIKAIESVCLFRKVDVNADEIADWIIEGEYLEPETKGLFGERIEKFMQFLEEFQGLVLKGYELLKNGVDWPLISVSEMKQLYLKLDQTKTHENFFDDLESENGFSVNYHKICEEIQEASSLNQVCEALSYYFVELHSKKSLGDHTYEFAWFTVQIPLFFKKMGVLLFHDNFDFLHLVTFTDIVADACRPLPENEWMNNPEFIRLCRGFEMMSETWSMNHPI